MGKKAKLEIKESLSDLKKLKARQESLQGQKRVLALIHIKTGKFATRMELAAGLGVHIRTLERWLKDYKKNGITEMVADKPRPKPSKLITAEIHQGLAQRVYDPSKPFLGYWEAQQWVQEEYGTRINYHWLRAYMIKYFETKVKRPRKVHAKKDEQAGEAFLKTALHAKSD